MTFSGARVIEHHKTLCSEVKTVPSDDMLQQGNDRTAQPLLPKSEDNPMPVKTMYTRKSTFMEFSLSKRISTDVA